MNPVITISTNGQLIITQSGGESTALYAAEPNKNLSISAPLLDTGNFVVMSSSDEFLWQSFDHPTDTLLPGMKLGVNHRTGRNWTLLSWFGESNPASGPFTLEWDPSVQMLTVKRRGIVYWVSGKLKDYYVESGDMRLRVKDFENFPREPDISNLNYNYTNVTSANEEYFTYSLIKDPAWTPAERQVISGWKIQYDGDIYHPERGTIVRPSLCYGYETDRSEGCALRDQPWWRNNGDMFEWKSGNFYGVDGIAVSDVSDNNSSLSLSDCREICWNDCECFAYKDDYGSDCRTYWRGKNLEFVQSLDGSATKKYVLKFAP